VAPLTIYGGNPLEGLPAPGGGTYGVDYRYVSFNHYQDHLKLGTGGGRYAPLGASGIFFSDDSVAGMVQLDAVPWWTGDSLADWSGGTTLQVTGSGGLAVWCDLTRFGRGNYQNLFTIDRPDTSIPWDTAGMCFIHEPTYIGKAYRNHFWPPFPGFESYSIQPDMGGTWMLAVDGPALFKEVYVLDTVWADYVFDPGYPLLPIDTAEKFMMKNRHLPDLPSAGEIAKTGIPIAKTEAAIARQLEEAMLYIGQLNEEVKALKAEVEDLKQEKGKP